MRTAKIQAPAAEVIDETAQTLPPNPRTALPDARSTTARLRWASVRIANLFPGLLFFLGLILIVHALAYVADTYAPDGNTRFLQVDRQHIAGILAGAGQINALALGNSHAGSLQMADLGFENGYRFARADGDLFEANYLIQHLTPRLSKIDVILIPISYFSFLEENTASQEVNIRRVHMYASLPAWNFLPGDFEAFVIGKSHTYLPIPRLIREDNWEGVFKALVGQQPESNGFIEVEAGDCSSLSREQLAASAENRVAKYLRLTTEMSANHPGLAEDVYASLAETTRYLQSQGIRLILFTPPYWQGYTDLYLANDAQTVQLMSRNMERLQQELGVEYYDFSRDPNFVQKPELFKDSDHLNSCGAALFSQQLSGRINPAQAVRP